MYFFCLCLSPLLEAKFLTNGNHAQFVHVCIETPIHGPHLTDTQQQQQKWVITEHSLLQYEALQTAMHILSSYSIAAEEAEQNEVYRAVCVQSPLADGPEVESYSIWFDGLSPVDPTVMITQHAVPVSHKVWAILCLLLRFLEGWTYET